MKQPFKIILNIASVVLLFASGYGYAENPPPKPNGCESVVCPAENGEFSLHLANPISCTSFCKCNPDGKASYFDCPPGLEFNAELQVCDWPQNAGCKVQK